jgi:hypothetical protein
MVSQLTEAMIANGVVLATVLASDPGHARKIGPAWLARPPIAAAVIIPLFADRPPANASSVAAELAGAAAGLPGSALLRDRARARQAWSRKDHPDSGGLGIERRRGAGRASLAAARAPEHTDGTAAILAEDRGVLFTGDVLCTHNAYTGRIGPQIMPSGLNADTRQAPRVCGQLDRD